MAPSKRKRASTVANGATTIATAPARDPKTELRNMWEFAALWQFCSIFSEALGLPEILIEDLEEELLHEDRHNVVPLIQLALLKHVTNRKGLNVEMFDAIVRGLYENYGVEGPYDNSDNGFASFDVPTKVKVLHQCSVWTFIDPEKIRGETHEHVYTDWRFNPAGHDAKGNTYYMLDDLRLYKLTAAPEPVVDTAKQSKGTKKRRITVEPRDPNEKIPGNEVGEWSVVCISYEEWKEFTESFKKSKHPDEKEFYQYLTSELLPILEKEEEERQRKIVEHKKKLELEAAVANRKRSSRIDAKLARQEEEAKEAERRREEEERQRLAKLEKKKQQKLHQEREKRLLARDERIKKRQEAQASRPAAPPAPEPERKSTRARSNGTASKKAGDKWDFDCVCGVHGANYDDGTLIIACDKCEVWQHLACLGIPKDKAEDEFVCARCIRLEKEAVERAEEEARQAIIREREEAERKVREAKEAEERKIREARKAEERRLRQAKEAEQRRQQEEQLALLRRQQELQYHHLQQQQPPVASHPSHPNQPLPLSALLSNPHSPAPVLTSPHPPPMNFVHYTPPQPRPSASYIPSPAAEVKPGPLSPSRQVVVNGFMHSPLPVQGARNGIPPPQFGQQQQQQQQQQQGAGMGLPPVGTSVQQQQPQQQGAGRGLPPMGTFGGPLPGKQ